MESYPSYVCMYQYTATDHIQYAEYIVCISILQLIVFSVVLINYVY